MEEKHFYMSPFGHVRYALATNQGQLDILADCLKVGKIAFMSKGKDAQCDLFEDEVGNGAAIVQIASESCDGVNEVHSLLLHEAVHIWQEVRERMCEDNPSAEFEAYSIQRIALDLFDTYAEKVKA